jgi:hypothetical protein
MTDFETRVREALHSDTAPRSADDLLHDVRRGARRRRARRTSSLAAAAALAVAAVGGIAVHRHSHPAVAERPTSELRVGNLAVSVTGSGQAYKVVANQGCDTPCSVVWRREPSGSWTRLAAFQTAPAPGLMNGAIDHLSMAPNGRDGWAWGTGVWSTHDGGDSWSSITGLVRRRDIYGLDIEVGATQAWAMMPHGRSLRLMHSPVGGDDWTPAPIPHWGQAHIGAVLPDSRVAISVGNGNIHREPFVVGDGTTAWQHVSVPCYRQPPLFDGRTFVTFYCGPMGKTGGGVEGDTKNGKEFDFSPVELGMKPLSRSMPLGQVEQLLVHRNAALVVTPDGVRKSDLRLGDDDTVSGYAHAGDHVWIVTEGHRLFASDDGGLHWRQE